MDETDAVALFVERARAISPDMADSPAVRELIRRLDGLPLAIELAAARVKLLGPEQILERIGQRLDLLKGGHDADERHVTLRATIAWSHDLLDDDEQQLFARLAVFRGGWTIGAAEAICECDLDTLGSLLDKSLIRQRTVENGDKWFWMLETIREYAAERLAASGKEDALRRLQTDWLIELANRAGTRGTIGIPGTWEVDLIAPEIDNVRATLEWATHTEPERGLVLAAYLEGYWLIRDAAEGVRWLEPLLAATPDADLELRGHALRALAGAHSVVGDAPRALARCQESLEHFIACGNEIQIASLRYHLATTMISTDEEAAAWPILEELLETFRELKLPRGEAQVLGYLGDRPSHEGDYARALELTLESARIAREDDWPWWAAGQLGGACWLEMLRENFEAAEAHGRAAVELDLRLGNHHRVTRAAGMLAVIAAERGQVERAGRLWGAIESEQIIRPVPGWEARLAEHGARVLRLDGPEFAIARAEGRLMSIAQAAEQPE
jgi:tetratricopeptide (TPR) repeat protein